MTNTETTATAAEYLELDQMFEAEARKAENLRIMYTEYTAQERIDFFGFRG